MGDLSIAEYRALPIAERRSYMAPADTTQDTDPTPLEVMQALYDDFLEEVESAGDRSEWNQGYRTGLRHAIAKIKDLDDDRPF